MDQKNMDGLVSVVSALGWKPELNAVLGEDTAVFYDALVARDPVQAYEIARRSNDPVLLAAVAERIIQSTVGGTDLEASIREMYLNPMTPDVPQPAAVPVSSPVPSSGFSIESLVDRYKVHGVPYRGQVCTVDMSKALLENGASHRQADWIEMTRQGEWKLPSGSLYFAVLAALYDNKDADNVREVKEMLATDLKRYTMMTSTCVRYAREGVDTVVHDLGYVTERSEEANIVGPDGYINEASGFDAAMGALVGTADSRKIEQVGRWITGKKSYIYRFNSKPEKDVERALVLDVNSDDRFNINADVNINGSRRARGMVVRSAENSQQKI